MGLWGFRIFENEHAIDTACSMASEIVTEILKTHENPTEEEIEKYEESPEYKALAYGTGSPDEEHLAILARLREKLDSGLGDQMMSKYRGLFERPSTWGEQGVYKYAYFIIGVLLMSTGARIRDEDQELLRQVVEEVGHIGPSGWVQFWAALDVYTPGFPRNFWEISCYRCGKTETDLGRPLLRCDICDHEDVAYCDTDCQLIDRHIHLGDDKHEFIPFDSDEDEMSMDGSETDDCKGVRDEEEEDEEDSDDVDRDGEDEDDESEPEETGAGASE